MAAGVGMGRIRRDPNDEDKGQVVMTLSLEPQECSPRIRMSQQLH